MFNVKFPWSSDNMVNLDWIINEIKKLHSDWSDFRVVNSIRFYGIWHIDRGYPAWALVSRDNIGYISTQIVPAGVDITNEDYWKPVADYSALLADMQERISLIEQYAIKGSNIVVVDPLGHGNYLTITEAIQAVNIEGTNSTIIILGGVYNEALSFTSICSMLTLIGIGNVVVNSSVEYPNAPIYANGNYSIHNIRFTATNSYACHIEGLNFADRSSYIRFYNCEFVSTGTYQAVGIGTGENYDIVLKDCNLVAPVSAIHCLYIHNRPDTTLNQVVRILGCSLYNGIKSICVQDQSHYGGAAGDSKMTISFKDCSSNNLNVLFIDASGNEHTNFIENSNIVLEKTSTNTLYGFDCDILDALVRDGYVPTIASIYGFIPIEHNSIYTVNFVKVASDGQAVVDCEVMESDTDGILINNCTSSTNNNRYTLALKLKENI